MTSRTRTDLWGRAWSLGRRALAFPTVSLFCLAFLAACGGNAANDSATAAPTRSGTAVTPKKAFLTLLTPAPPLPAGGTSAPRTAVAARSPVAGSVTARGTAAAPAGGFTNSNPLDACTLVTLPELTTAMGEAVAQQDRLDEGPQTDDPQLAGFLYGGCQYGAPNADANDARTILLITLRKDPGSTAGSFSGASDFWSALKQSQTRNMSMPVPNVGDDAFAIPVQNGAEIYILKGERVLAVSVRGYSGDSRTKAVAIATRAATRL